MAATNKCLARSNKSRHVIRDKNEWASTVGTAEGPCAVRPASDARCTVGAPRQQWRGRRDVLLSEKGMKTL